VPFMETSAKANINVEDAFVSMAKSIKKKIDEKVGDWVPARPKWPFASMTSSSPNTNKQTPHTSPQCPPAVFAVAIMKRKPPSCPIAVSTTHRSCRCTTQYPLVHLVPFMCVPFICVHACGSLLCASVHAALPTRSLPRPSQARASPATRLSVTLVARPRSKGFWLACAPSCRTAVRP